MADFEEETETDNVPYPAHFELFRNVWLGSTRDQIAEIINNGRVGENPSDAARFAVTFEVACLHIYLLDHHIRGAKRDDPILEMYWQWGARNVLSWREWP